MFQSFLLSSRRKQVIKKCPGKHLRFLKNELSMNEKPFVMPTSADEELLLWFKLTTISQRNLLTQKE